MGSIHTISAASSVTVTSPFPPEGIPELWRWLENPRRPNFNDSSPKTLGEFTEMARGVLSIDVSWAVRVGERISGYVGFRLIDGSCGVFHGVVISPEMRGRGVGKAAVSAVIQALRERGMASMQAAFYIDNEPITKLFRGLGWAPINTYTGVATRDGVDSPVALWGNGERGRVISD